MAYVVLTFHDPTAQSLFGNAIQCKYYPRTDARITDRQWIAIG
jgi:hypothetical protein